MNGTDAARMSMRSGRGGGGWGWTPPLAWVALTMLLAVRGLYSMVPIAWDASLPPALAAYLQAGIAVGMVNLLWGGWVMLAARFRWRALRRGFLAWQSFNLVAIAASIGFAVLYGNFLTTASGLILPGLEFTVGIALIVHALRLPDTTAPDSAAPSAPAAAQPASTTGTVLRVLLGGIAGGVSGGLAGFPLGVLLADRLDISCFEGGCGYFAAAIGLLLIVVGFVAGVVVAINWTRGARNGHAS